MKIDLNSPKVTKTMGAVGQVLSIAAMLLTGYASSKKSENDIAEAVKKELDKRK